MTTYTNPAAGAGSIPGGAAGGAGPGSAPAADQGGPDPRGDGPTGQAWYGDRYSRGRLYRSTTDRVWAGVCGGLAEHFGWEPSVTRIGYAILALLTGIFPMLVLYVVMAVVVPNGSASPGAYPGWQAGPSTSVRPIGSGVAAMVFGVLLIVGGAVALIDQYALVDTRLVGPSVAVLLGLFFVALSVVRRP